MPDVTTARSLREDVDDWMMLRADAPLDRWGVYRRLHEESPCYWREGQLFLARHADCLAVLRDNRLFLNGFEIDSPLVAATMKRLDPDRRQRYREVLEHQLCWLTSSNGAKHVALRTLATRVFSVRAIEDMRARIIREIDDRLDTLASRETIELVGDFAYQLPLTIISEMLDIPEDVRESIHVAWHGMTALIGKPPELVPEAIDEAHAGMVALEARLKAVMDLRRGAKTTDLLARLLAAYEEDGSALAERDIMGIIAQMVIAGHQTTQDTIASAVHELFRHRDQWDAVVVDPSLIPNAVEEVLRYRTPGQMIGRTAAADTEVAGIAVPAGTRITCLLGAANRDPAVFETPERFDIRRPNAKAHVAFSGGNHFCLGASLSRMEVTGFLTRFAARFPNADRLHANVEWIPNTFLLGLRRLDIRLRP